MRQQENVMVLTTGRSLCEIRLVFDFVDLVGYLITNDGTIIYDAKEHLLLYVKEIACEEIEYVSLPDYQPKMQQMNAISVVVVNLHVGIPIKELQSCIEHMGEFFFYSFF